MRWHRGGKRKVPAPLPCFLVVCCGRTGSLASPSILLASGAAAVKPRLCILVALKLPCSNQASPFFTFIIPLSPEFASWSTRGMVDVYPEWFVVSLKSRLRDPVLYKARFWGERARSRVSWLIPSIASWGIRRSTVEIWHSSVLFCPVVLFL